MEMRSIASRMKRLCAALLLAWTVMDVCALSVSHLRVNAVSNPVGLDESPRFSWIIESDERGCMQQQYRILIFTGDDGATPVYDSGTVSSSQSTHVFAEGFTPSASTRYHWRVEVSDNHGNEAASNGQASFVTGLMDAGWSGAQWIRSRSEGGVPRFRKSVTLAKTVRQAWLYTTALGLYDLHINGQRVGHVRADGGTEYEELKPGWTDYRKTVNYSTHDVTPYLRQGVNVLGATVTGGWWSGNISVGYYGSKPVAFLAKLVVTYTDGSRDIIVTDTSWTVNNDGPLLVGDIWNGETYDATREDGWTTAESGSDQWDSCDISTDFHGSIVSVTGAEVWRLHDKTLAPRSVSIYEGSNDTGTDFGMVNTVSRHSGQAAFTLRKGQTAVIDFGQVMVGWSPFTVKGRRGAQLRLRYAEMLNDDGSRSRGNDGPGGSIYTENLRAARATLHYTLRGDGGGEGYCPFATYFGFRYCELTADDDIEVVEVNGLPVSSQTEDCGTVTTDNAALNQLISNIQWGQRGNLVSIPTDCPQRSERYGWTGDSQAFARTAMYNAMTEAFYGNYMSELRNTQNDEGAYPDICPPVYDWYGDAGWSDAGIIIPYQHYLMYGDKEQLRRQFPSMERFMAWHASRTEGEWKYPGGGTAYGDWLAYHKCDNRYVSVAYYAHDAQLMAKMARFLSTDGNDEYARKADDYELLFKNIKDEFNRRYWNLRPGLNMQSVSAIPIAFNLIDGEKRDLARALLRNAIKKNGGLLSTGFLGTSVILPALSECGLTHEAYNLLLQRGNPSWLYSVDQGATTIWERWDSYTKEKGFGPADMNSFNHYAYGAVGEWMYRYMAGIDTDETAPGFAHIILKPEPDVRDVLPEGQEPIREVSASYRSCHGTITSAWKVNDDGETEYRCTVPANTEAMLQLPVAAFGIEAPEDATDTADGSGAEYVGLEGDRHVYRLVAGSYRFKGEKQAEIKGSIDGGKTPVAIDRANGQIVVYDDGVEAIKLYDEKGALVCSAPLGSRVLDISRIAHGIYIVDVKSLTHWHVKFAK